MDGLSSEEYFDEAPDVDPYSVWPEEFFRKLEGPRWEKRVEQMNVEQELAKMPKAYDVAIALSMDTHGDKNRTSSTEFSIARNLMKELIEAGLAHTEVGRCGEFFDNFDERQKLKERLAELEAEKYKATLIEKFHNDG